MASQVAQPWCEQSRNVLQAPWVPSLGRVPVPTRATLWVCPQPPHDRLCLHVTAVTPKESWDCNAWRQLFVPCIVPAFFMEELKAFISTSVEP